MSKDAKRSPAATGGAEWDTSSHEAFYAYYEKASASAATQQRFRAVCDLMLRIHAESGAPAAPLAVLDVGCGAGAQSAYWEQRGHRYAGLDINAPLIELARRRAAETGSPARFDVGSATALPYSDGAIDICLLPELLEHVVEWRQCVDEALRVTRPGGLIFINTSNKLCPLQQEFNLPLYSWYPAPLKAFFERKAVGDWPSLVNYAKYPAVNWFSYYALRDYLERRGCRCRDRFELIDPAGRSRAAAAVLALLRASPLLRFVGQVITPYTQVVARR